MATYHFWRRLLDEEGRPVENGSVTVYLERSTTKANIYDGSEIALSNPITTDSTGKFEFYVRDYSENNGYAATQKFKLAWAGTDQDGTAILGEVDRLNIFPNLFQVDEIDSINNSFNKMTSNDLAYDWDNHIVESYSDEVHDMVQVDEYDSVDMTPNKLISNYFMNQLWSQLGSASTPSIESTGAVVVTKTVETTTTSGASIKWLNLEDDWVSHETWPTDTTNWAAICWSPELSIFVATSWGNSDDGGVMYSPDGTNWTPATAAVPTNRWFSVTWSPELGLFCAVSDTGTNDRVMTSPDGINWTSRDASAETNWGAICWSPELGLFCAVASNAIMTSPDGTNWTSQTSPVANAWTSICWSPELGLFCAVSSSGTGNRVMTSPNGITWTWRISSDDSGWKAICWSPELSLFAAVGYAGAADRIMTSPDGTNWTTQTEPSVEQWYSITWGAEAGAFVAVGVTATTMISYDGITWTEKAAVDGVSPWYGVTWSPELSIFCTVHYSGATDRVMTFSGEFQSYYADIEHSLNIEHPVAVSYESSGSEYQPYGIESYDQTPPYNTIRIYSVLDEKTEVTVIG